jgi:tRNA (guanosine-2'-O-)-methyltransferase
MLKSIQIDQLDRQLKAELVTYLADFMSDQKLLRMNDVLNMRTRQFVVVLENIYHPHNASAVLRSCDCFGIQNVYTIESRNSLDISSGVSMNAQKWLTLKRYRDSTLNNLEEGLTHLKNNGYAIVAASPHAETTLNMVPAEKKLALMFGSEKEGLSAQALKQADMTMKIPMYGFTESYNLSVSVALTLYDLTERMRRISENWHLTESEKEDLRLEWMIKSVRAGRRLVSLYLEKKTT